ncbi:MAG: CHAT domain-containing protein [Deltaproteobacteria bacterium]|nr:CHAT domain-containing protein [Deltaproteobacteria bacterium]
MTGRTHIRCRGAAVALVAALVATGPSCGPRARTPAGPARLRGLEQGSQALDRARFAEAERAFREALQVYRKRGDAGATAATLTWLARTARAQGRPILAVALTKEALALYAQVDDKAGAADAHSELAHASLEAADFGEAREEFLWAVANSRAARDPSREAVARLGLARISVVHGAYGEALSEIGRAEKLGAALGGAAAGRVFAEVGALRGELYDFAAALPALERGTRDLLAAGDRRGAAAALLTLGRLQLEARLRDTGRENLRRSVDVASGLGSSQLAAAAAHEAGDILAGDGDEVGARELYEIAERVYAEVGDRDGAGRLDLSRALAELQRGDYRAAVPRLERAAATLEVLGERYGAGEARVLLARARVQLKDAAGAAGELQRALDHAAETSAPELAWRAYMLLGHLTETLMDREAEAARFYEGAVQALETMRAGIDFVAGSGAGGRVAGVPDDAYYRMTRLRIRVHRRSGEARALDQAILVTEQARSRSTFDLLARAGATLADSPEQRKRARALAGEERAIALGLTRPGIAADTRRSMRTKLERIRAARAAEEQQAMRFAAAQAEPVTAAVVRRVLHADEAVLSYFLGPDGSTLVTLTREEARAYDLPSRDALERLTLAWRRAALKGDAGRTQAAAADLTRLLLAPARDALHGKKRLVVVPHGPLWLVPFAALADPAGFLGARMVITHAPSISAWLRARETPHGGQARRELLAIAGSKPRATPAAEALTVRGFKLGTPPRSAREVYVAAAAFGVDRCTVLAAGAGEEGLLRANLQEYRRLHLAAPVICAETRSPAMQPAIALGGVIGADGLLQLREIVALSLPMSVVAIGAIEAPADLADGSSFEALAHAFRLAGAGALIMPLWEPDDVAAAAFWTAFYRGLHRGQGAADALAGAQREVARKHPQPRSFAPFVLIGAEGTR